MIRYISLLLFIGLAIAQNYNINTNQDSKNKSVQKVNVYQLGQITNKTKLKKNPKIVSRNFPITLDVGDTVKVFDEKNKKYVKIEVAGETGWVSNKYLELIPLIKDRVKKNVVVNNNKQKKVVYESETVRAKNKKKSKNTKRSPNLKEIKRKVEKPKEQKVVLQQIPPVQVPDLVESSNSWVMLLLSILVIGLGYLLFQTFMKVRKMEKRFKPVIDVDKEIDTISKNLKILRKDYTKSKTIYDNIREKIDKLSDDLEMMAHGLYEPQFNFDTSDAYKEKIRKIRAYQKSLIRYKQAVPANTNWTIDGSKRKGNKFINRMIRIALRAFNGECDSIITKVRWNNVDRMEERIERSRDAIDKLLETATMYIANDYVQLKIQELHITHEYHEKKYEEKEEIRRIRAEEREEKKVLQEIEKAKKEAERDEKLFNEALDRAKQQLGLLSGEELTNQQSQIKLLEEQLADALEKKERAISRAQLTKSGHVYVISNVGSFGESIYKIGLTRRLEPEIRVKELGDASVPFSFDIHAMIFSEDAPALERQLHEKFYENRVNLINKRKEYFKLDLGIIKDAVMEIDSEVDFISTIESREYKETKSMIAQKENKLEELKNEEEKFPDTI